MPRTEFALWMMPREPLRSQLQKMIRQLAAALDAVEFEPHITVFAGPSTNTEAHEIATRIAKRFEPIEAIAEKVDYGEVYTKTVFVQFRESPALRQMHELARSSFTQPSNYQLNPHLSLVYKKMAEAEKQELCRRIRLPMGNYLFDAIQMVETEVPIEEPGPIKRLRIVSDAKLGPVRNS